MSVMETDISRPRSKEPSTHETTHIFRFSLEHVCAKFFYDVDIWFPKFRHKVEVPSSRVARSIIYNSWKDETITLSRNVGKQRHNDAVPYRVSTKSFPDYKHLLQENHVEYKYVFLPLLELVSKVVSCVYIKICNIWFLDETFPDRWIGRDGPTPRPPRSPDIIPPLTSFYGGMLRTKCFRHQLQILQI